MKQSKQSPGKSVLSVFTGGLLAFVLSSFAYAADNTGQGPDATGQVTETPQLQPVQKQAGAGTNREHVMSEKELAFRAFYQKDPACDSFRDDNAMDRCRFAYMAAKKEFEKVWAARNKTR